MRGTRRLRREEQGFTLIELLVVILIIGILAAIALPAFLGQQKKGQDADAKSNARNVMGQVEACQLETGDYSQCLVPALRALGLSSGAAPGDVAMTAGTDNYVITAHSHSGTDFVITRATALGPVTRTCTAPGQAGCPADGSW